MAVAWLVLWVAMTLAGIAGIVASANNIRFRHHVAREVHEELVPSTQLGGIDQVNVERLPDPVRRYVMKAAGGNRAPVRRARLRQSGTFRPDLNGSWYRITGVQYFTTDPPGFIWWGRVHLLPGVWIEARDRSIDGVGNMLVVAESTFVLNDARGPELDQGALLRLLGEMAWVPTAYLDARYVRWSAVDDRSAKAVLAVSGGEVEGLFEFGDDDLPVTFRAQRFRDVGGGHSVLTPFLGEYHDYRPVDGLLVPHEMVGSWIVNGTPMPYARFRVVDLEFDVTR